MLDVAALRLRSSGPRVHARRDEPRRGFVHLSRKTARCEPSVNATRTASSCPSWYLWFESLPPRSALLRGSSTQSVLFGGEGGIRTLGTVARTLDWGCPHRPVLGPSGLRASCLPQIPCSPFGLRAEWREAVAGRRCDSQ